MHLKGTRLAIRNQLLILATPRDTCGKQSKKLKKKLLTLARWLGYFRKTIFNYTSIFPMKQQIINLKHFSSILPWICIIFLKFILYIFRSNARGIIYFLIFCSLESMHASMVHRIRGKKSVKYYCFYGWALIVAFLILDDPVAPMAQEAS